MTATSEATMAVDPEPRGLRARWKADGSTRSAPPPGQAVYGLGMIGALVYFIGTAESRPDYLLAVGKAVVWPALLVYRAFKVLGA